MRFALNLSFGAIDIDNGILSTQHHTQYSAPLLLQAAQHSAPLLLQVVVVYTVVMKL